MTYADRIKPTDSNIFVYLENLANKQYQIPTFQREIEWDRNNVKELWDTIYRFYPFGSILIWKTPIKLQKHRAIGGFPLNDNGDRAEYQYILDGQQRTVALFTSLYGGKIEDKGDFNPTLYIDLTIKDENDSDENTSDKRFLFWDEIDDRNGALSRNTPKSQRFKQGLIVKLQDVRLKHAQIEGGVVKSGYTDWDHPYRVQLRRIKEVLDNYRVPFIELRGIQVAEVCEIFERINQAGKPLGIFDIVVAKTYRTEDKVNGIKQFYLRDLLDGFRNDIKASLFSTIDDLTFLQMMAILVYQYVPDSNVQNITDRYLNNLRAEHIESIWNDAKPAILKTLDFFDNLLKIKGPDLIPYRYFYMTLLFYFYRNNKPDWGFLEKYFWYYSFHNQDLLSNTTDLWGHIQFLKKQMETGTYKFERFLIDKNTLRTSSYSGRGRISRSILSLYSNQMPKDWAKPHNHVMSEVYYMITDKPNLHHIFPSDYIDKHPGTSKLSSNSLMNIAYLKQITNLNISNDNPLVYLKEFDTPEFTDVLKTHLTDPRILEWSRADTMPENALDEFIESRIDNIISKLREKLSDITFDIIDTKEGLLDKAGLVLLEKVPNAESSQLSSLPKDNNIKKNPNWERNELILALDLYFRINFSENSGSLGANNNEVVNLSELLNKLRIHPIEARKENFRNPDGVYMKLCNFLAIDPNYKGKGLTAGGKLDKEIWDEFSNNKEGMSTQVTLIIKEFMK